MVRKSKPTSIKANKPRSRRPKAEPVDEFSAWLRVSRSNGQLPQGCKPAQKHAYLQALADMHNVQPIKDPASMVAAFWPADESVDDVVNAVRALRRQ